MKTIQSFVFLLFVFPGIYCQTTTSEVIAPSGGSFELGDIAVSWTIGDNIIDFSALPATVSIDNPEIQKGFMEFEDGVKLRVYPTITSDFVHVIIQNEKPSPLQAELLDIKAGRILLISLETAETALDISQLKPGLFLLKISDTNSKVEALFKIIKK